ncbi:putative ADP-ribosylation factor 6 [Paramicrosporidium saccamoebae]|uniref:Putative ADP-ribosylation factor 6 n=1 Tax=Paramicrosporidium saccamoebae TaxID=1246581 RepID=A0A2H9TM91_9FUNG|nr:putative ADP-ribosylation factor 6 [Paramicrosporidium saccamoebae]
MPAKPVRILWSNVCVAILYKLKFNQTVTTIPTAGFNVECLIHKNIKFHVWDKIRPLWRHYHTGTKALIFVVDSQDRDRLHEARVELHRILTARELQDAILLVFANKQDLRQSMTTREVEERLGLDKFAGRVWTVMGSCATSGDGLMEGLNWLAENIRTPRTRPAGPDVSDSEGSTSAPDPVVVSSP